MLKRENLHGYQNKTVEHIKNNTHCAAFLEMGLGKTVSSLTAVNDLMYEDLEVDRVLVVAPKRVASNVWSSEIKNWAHLKHLRISRIIGTPKQRMKALKTKADIYTIGRDNLAWLCGVYGGSSLPFDMLIIDESSSFKNHDSLRFKALRKVQPSFSRVVLLTGTPAPNSLLDLWAQVYLLDRGERLEKFITQYREIYFRADKRNGSIIHSYKLRDGAEEKIYNKINDICISMSAEDYLEIPGRIDNIVSIEFPEALKKTYKDFEREMVLELFSTEEDRTDISVANAAALSNKLLQFANGAVYDENKNVHEVHKLKIEACKELVEDAAGAPVLIAYTYQHDRDRLLEALKKYSPRQLKTDEDIEDWNEGFIQVLIMHPASGGHGLNLQAGGNRIIWFGNTWSLELEQQFNARLFRQGQKDVVIINKLVAEGTLDRRVISRLGGKAEGQAGLMEAVKAVIAEYF